MKFKMARLLAFVLALALVSVVLCKPLEENKAMDQKVHRLWKRFINTALASGNFDDNGLSKLRTKRGVAEDCEKLELCKLHARSSRNFLAAYELYFVSKENAKLWDHQTHTAADCDRRFSCGGNNAPRPSNNYRSYRNEDYDYNY